MKGTVCLCKDTKHLFFAWPHIGDTVAKVHYTKNKAEAERDCVYRLQRPMLNGDEKTSVLFFPQYFDSSSKARLLLIIERDSVFHRASWR